jgi:DNA-binding Lrp family transcriptional regulator
MGIVRRFGPVLNPRLLGASTLAALAVPADRFDDVAKLVNEYPQVTHNYRRDHEWNMWFVLTARSADKRDEILEAIESRSGCDLLDLPRLTEYATDLTFPVAGSDQFGQDADRAEVRPVESDETGRDLTDLEASILLEIQNGMPLSATPYRDVADSLGVDVTTLIGTVADLLEDGFIKRIGFVVDHRVTGFRANAMVAWDVPDEQLDAVGRAVGALPYVTKCYHRPRRPAQDWPYNLFTMIHARESTAVDDRLAEIEAEHLPYPHVRLDTVEKLKQTGARYEALITEDGP